MRCFQTVLFVFTTFFVQCQSLSIHLFEKKSELAIPNAKVRISFQEKDSLIAESMSNIDGKVFFKSVPINEKLLIQINHAMYKELYKSFIHYGRNDTLNKNFELSPIQIKELTIVNLKAKSKVDTVFGSNEINIKDFEVIGKDSVLLLTYLKSKNKASGLILKLNDDELRYNSLSESFDKLIKDYKGNIHAISSKNCSSIHLKNDSIIQTNVSRNYYLNYIAPIVDTTTTKSILSNYNEIYPAFDYYVLDKVDSSYKKITNIKDDWMMELYRSEYKWVDVRSKLWAREKEQLTGVDKEIWIGANYFTQSIYWKEVYAPMFQKNDSIYIFNYPKDKLEVFDNNGDFLFSIPIFHHYQSNKSGFKRNLIQDNRTGIVYANYQKDGFCYIAPINLSSGTVGEMFKLNYRYVDKIRVYNNKVFYIYRPFESIQKKFLYAENLPFTFRNAR